jgi:hypothetical protein
MRIWEIRVLIGPFVTHWGGARDCWYRRGTGRENWATWTSHFSLCTRESWRLALAILCEVPSYDTAQLELRLAGLEDMLARPADGVKRSG